MNKDKLIEVLSIQSESYNQEIMLNYILTQLDEIQCDCYIEDGNLYVIKGNSDIYPCIVAHMDTVHSIVGNLTPIEINGNLTGFNAFTMEQTGIGGDDKVGIFIALQCILKFDTIKAVFFRDEEVGCNGSYDSDVIFFNDCRFVLQCDRKGNKDFITNASGVQLSSKKFQDEIKGILKRYKYNFNDGMMTDVMALKENGISCSMANISCGYYNPHSHNEYVNIKDVNNCLNLVMDIIENINYGVYPCKYKRSYKNYGNVCRGINFNELNNKYLRPDDLWQNEIKMSIKEANCECCDERALLTYVSDYNIEMCDKCIKQYVNV